MTANKKKKIKDEVRKAIIADRVLGESIRDIAEKHHVSTTSVQRIIKENPQVTRLVIEKKEQNTADILDHMEGKRQEVCNIIDIALEVLPDKIKNAKTASDITTALGTLLDKFLGAYKQMTKDDIADDDPITKALKEKYGRDI